MAGPAAGTESTVQEGGRLVPLQGWGWRGGTNTQLRGGLACCRGGAGGMCGGVPGICGWVGIALQQQMRLQVANLPLRCKRVHKEWQGKACGEACALQ